MYPDTTNRVLPERTNPDEAQSEFAPRLREMRFIASKRFRRTRREDLIRELLRRSIIVMASDVTLDAI